MEDSVREDLIYKTSVIIQHLDKALRSVIEARHVLDDEFGTRRAREDLDLLRQQVETVHRYSQILASRQERLLELTSSQD